MSFKEKKENNFGIISNVSFMSDTTMLKCFLYKNFHCSHCPVNLRNHIFPALCGQTSQTRLSTFSYYVHSFLTIIFLPLSVLFNFFSKSTGLFSISSNVLKYVTLVSIVLVDRSLQHHVHLKIPLTLITSSVSPKSKHSPEGS